MRWRDRIRLSVSAALAGLVVLVAGCTTSVPGTGAAAGAPTAAVADTVAGMLALLPPVDDAVLGIVAVSRWHAAAEAYGVPVPAPGAPADEVLQYLSELTTGAAGVGPSSDLMALRTAARSSTEDDFGFGRQQIAADVVAGLPPRLLAVAAVARALDAEQALSAQLPRRPEGSELPYDTVGIGIAEDGGARVVLAYSTASAADAREVAGAVTELVTSGRTVVGNRPWSDLLADANVRAEGALVVATFTAVGPAGRWAGFLPARERLF